MIFKHIMVIKSSTRSGVEGILCWYDFLFSWWFMVFVVVAVTNTARSVVKQYSVRNILTLVKDFYSTMTLLPPEKAVMNNELIM
jgi:hypothetical protein